MTRRERSRDVGRTRSKVCKASVSGLGDAAVELKAESASELLAELAAFLDTCDPADVVWITSTVTDGLLDVVAPRLGEIDDDELHEEIREAYHETGEGLDPYDQRTTLRVDPQVGEQTDRYIGINNAIYTIIIRPDGSRMLYSPGGIPHVAEGATCRSLLWGSWDNGWGDGSFSLGLYGPDILEICDENSDGDSVPDDYELKPAPDTDALVRLVVETAQGKGTGSIGLLAGLMMDVDEYGQRFVAAVNDEPEPEGDDRMELGVNLTPHEQQIARRIISEGAVEI
jgi:hypothetical protein